MLLPAMCKEVSMKIRRSLMAMGLVAAMACLPLFATSGAILSPMSGTVAVNGLPVSAGSAIVAGDLVATSVAGSARMVLAGGSVIAASNTNFRMVNVNNATEIRLNNGLVKVTGLLPVALSAMSEDFMEKYRRCASCQQCWSDGRIVDRSGHQPFQFLAHRRFRGVDRFVVRRVLGIDPIKIVVAVDVHAVRRFALDEQLQPVTNLPKL